jgi:hypothetical protein
MKIQQKSKMIRQIEKLNKLLGIYRNLDFSKFMIDIKNEVKQ